MDLEKLIYSIAILSELFLLWIVFKKPRKKKYPIISNIHQFIGNTHIGITMPQKKTDLKKKLKAQKKLNRKIKKEVHVDRIEGYNELPKSQLDSSIDLTDKL
jgi:hypothetical protein